MCCIVAVPENQCLLQWGCEILLCSTCAWLALISATSIPPFLACSSLRWHASSSSSFLFLIISHEGFCVSVLHFEGLIIASVFCIILHLPAIDFFMFRLLGAQIIYDCVIIGISTRTSAPCRAKEQIRVLQTASEKPLTVTEV